MFKNLNFEKCGEEYKEKNRMFFNILFEVNQVFYERRSDEDTYYDLLWLNRGTEEEICIPVPVFLQIIGHNEDHDYTSVVNILEKEKIPTEVDHGRFLPVEIIGDANAIKKYLLDNPEVFCEEYLSDEMADDKEFILDLIKKEVKPLNSHMSFVSVRLKGDKDVALAAIKLATNNYISISPELQNDTDIIEAMFENEEGPHWLIAGPKEVLDNLDVMSRAVRQSPGMLHVHGHASDYLKKNNKLMVEALGACNDPQVILNYFQSLSVEQRDNPQIQKVIEDKKCKFGSRDVSIPNPDRKSRFLRTRVTLGSALRR